MLHRLLIMAALLGALPAQADIYKWRDEAGRIHYGAVPPPGVELQIIAGPRGQAAPPPAAAPLPQVTPIAPAPVDPQDPARSVYEANCQEARQALATLESEQPVAEIGPDGSRTLLSDEQRQARLARVRREAAFFCDESQSPVRP